MKAVAKTKQSGTHKRALRKKASAPNVTVIGPLKATALKDILWVTLNDLRSNQLPANRADAIAAQAREILRTVKTQLQVTNAAKRPVPAELVTFAES